MFHNTSQQHQDRDSNAADDVSALNSADQSPTQPLPQQQPHPFQQPHQQQPNNNSHHHHTNINNSQNNNSCILIDSPPPNPILMSSSSRRNSNTTAGGKDKKTMVTNNNNSNRHYHQFTDDNNNSETCPFCSVDAAQLTHEIRNLQQQVSQLNHRVGYSEEKTKQDRDKVDQCFSQIEEYSLNLSLVTKWTKTVGSCLPKLMKGMMMGGSTSEYNNNYNNNRNNNNKNSNTTRNDLGKPPMPRNSAGNNAGGGVVGASISTEVSAILNEEQENNNDAMLYEEDRNDNDYNNNDENGDVIPVKEVRKMFRSFRDEIVRLRERNEMLEQRVNDAVCKFEGTNVYKLKEEVEGRLRTMMHSLHETMNGSSSPTAELAQQVNSLRTEVELVRSKSEASNTQRALLEQRLSDTSSKLKDITDRDQSRNYRSEQVYSEEIREIRSAMKELSSTVNHRLESERSAREFDAGDIRSQLKVLLRSPSPMARIGGDGLITMSTSPQR